MIDVGGVSLYAREIGRGPTVIVLHGGPDFDHSYLLPDLDRLKDSYHLVYYDQRGRGRSAANVRPVDVTLASDLDDIDAVRRHFGVEKPALLGHSWGALLAVEYALRHSDRVSRLILMNPAPVSAAGIDLLRRSYTDMDRQRAIMAGVAYNSGDPDAVIARYRIHFEHALKRREDYEKLLTAMAASFASQGREGIVKARAVEDHLYLDTWQVPGYDLLPKLEKMRVPTLVIVGDSDFIPSEIAGRIAQAIPDATLITIKGCGHFAYLERPDEVRAALTRFFRQARARR
jgi:proline iminopeptidase